MSLADWLYVTKHPEDYSADRIQQIAQAENIGIPEMQSVIQAGYIKQKNAAEAANANYKPPELQAQKDLAQIDPAAAALTHTLANTYNQTVPQAAATSPATTALSNEVLGSYNASLGRARAQAALGSSLSPEMEREIAQYVRGAQVARGNSEGGAQTVQEAMTTGQAGEALRQQRENYLQGVQGEGANLAAQRQNYLQNVLQQATGYLGSGQTAGGRATSYLNNAINQQNAALGGYPIQQNAQSFPPSYLYLDPNAGNAFAQGTQGFMGQGVGATPGSPGGQVPWGSIAGAAGSVLGGVAGSFIPGVGTVIGAGLGGLAGTTIGTAASGGFCWVAREVFGADDPRWLAFREWLFSRAPTWLMQFYAVNGQTLANRIKNKPRIKRVIKSWMETQLAAAI